MLADLAVVADLHLIVDFGALAHHSIGHGAAIYHAVGADFHIIAKRYAAGLRNFKP